MLIQDTPREKDYFPRITRNILRLFRTHQLPNIVSIDVEPDYGYVVRLCYTNGTYRFALGYNLGLNPAAASEVAKDKGYTKFVLRTIGVNCPEGAEFLSQWWYEEIGREQQHKGNTNVRSAADAVSYVDKQLGYPVYVKPVDGSKGQDIFVAENQADLEQVLQRYEEKRVRVSVIEKPIQMPDYRIVCLDGELVCAYRRVPLSVTGDGQHTIAELLSALQDRYRAEGRDTSLDVNDAQLQFFMARHGLTADTIPDRDERVVLAAISNLSAGGTAEDVTAVIDSRWVELAVGVAKSFNLRLIGLDLACANITSPDADYSVIEVNSSPGLDHYYSLGPAQQAIVDRLYIRALNSPPAS